MLRKTIRRRHSVGSLISFLQFFLWLCILVILYVNLSFFLHTYHNNDSAKTRPREDSVVVKSFAQVQRELPSPPKTLLSRKELLRSDFAQVEAYWKDKTLTAEEIALRYQIPRTSSPICTSKANSTIRVGYVPCTNCHPTNLADYGLIPRLIFQSWKFLELEVPICEMATSWSTVNPEYDYLLFDDTAIRRMIELDFGPNLLADYDCLRVGAAKSDVWRLLAIYLFGGIYFDMDSMAKPEFPFRLWGFANHTVVTGKGKDGAPHQWGLLYTPKHPIIREAVLLTLDNLATADRKARRGVYGVSYYAFQKAFAKFRPKQYNTMPGWGDHMNEYVVFTDYERKKAMFKHEAWWQQSQIQGVWKPECRV